jgi:hypothetical protein
MVSARGSNVFPRYLRARCEQACNVGGRQCTLARRDDRRTIEHERAPNVRFGRDRLHISESSGAMHPAAKGLPHTRAAHPVPRTKPFRRPAVNKIEFRKPPLDLGFVLPGENGHRDRKGHLVGLDGSAQMVYIQFPAFCLVNVKA